MSDDKLKIGMRRQPVDRKRPQSKSPLPKKKYYEPLYGTPECPYKGKKKGRKSAEERIQIRSQLEVKIKKGKFVMYFD